MPANVNFTLMQFGLIVRLYSDRHHVDSVTGVRGIHMLRALAEKKQAGPKLQDIVRKGR